MMTEAATSSPNSVRRRALNARWGRAFAGAARVVDVTAASLSVPVWPTGGAMDDMTGTMRRWMIGDERHAVTDQTAAGPGPTATVESGSRRDPVRHRSDRTWPSGPSVETPEEREAPAGPGTPGIAGVDPDQEQSVDPFERDDRFINRELSWLEFGARLLDLASDNRVPLVERVKFLAIFSEGLDEFFQVRVAGLEDQVAAGLRTRSPDGLQPAQQLDAITARATELVEWQSRIFLDQVAPALREAGVLIADWHTLDERRPSSTWPRSSAGRSSPSSPPWPSTRATRSPTSPISPSIWWCGCENPATGEARIARVKVPPLIPRLVALPDRRRLVPVEQVIAAHLDSIFPSMTITEHHAFRVTRNADLSVEEDDAEDLLAAVELELHRRRFGQAVRLEVAVGISTDLLDMLIGAVDIPEHNVYLFDVPLDLDGLRSLTDSDLPELTGPAWSPVAPRGLGGGAGHLRRPGPGRRAGPPSLRVLRRLGRGVHRRRRRRPRGAGHQADPLPDRHRQPGGGGADPGLGGRASRSPRWSSSRPASTSRPTSPGPGRWKRPACRSSTGW